MSRSDKGPAAGHAKRSDFRHGLLGMLLAVSAGWACRPSAPAPQKPRPASRETAAPSSAAQCGPGHSSGASSASVAVAPVEPGTAAPRVLQRCFPDQPPWLDAAVGDLLDRAAEALAAADGPRALACSEEAARQAPRSVEAHHGRAAALLQAGRIEDARDALTLALSLDPDDAETLAAAADLYINHVPPSAERSAIGLEHARRAGALLPRRDRRRAARLLLLEGQALTDLGRAAEALRRIDRALAISPEDQASRYERGVALFELCRFPEARRAFERVLATDGGHPHALYHLGLIDERDGDEAAAARRFAEATRRDPRTFPPPPEMLPSVFTDRVRHALDALPPDVKADLTGVTIDVAELPALDDLTAESPPLSPTILGLYRGRPLGSDHQTKPQGRSAASGRPTVPPPASRELACDSERAIVLYRRNLLRTLHDGHEIDAAIARTLLHEVGHLRGEDDGSLRDRGLE